jgi:hypothetical protein
MAHAYSTMMDRTIVRNPHRTKRRPKEIYEWHERASQNGVQTDEGI